MAEGVVQANRGGATTALDRPLAMAASSHAILLYAADYPYFVIDAFARRICVPSRPRCETCGQR